MQDNLIPWVVAHCDPYSSLRQAHSVRWARFDVALVATLRGSARGDVGAMPWCWRASAWCACSSKMHISDNMCARFMVVREQLKKTCDTCHVVSVSLASEAQKESESESRCSSERCVMPMLALLPGFAHFDCFSHHGVHGGQGNHVRDRAAHVPQPGRTQAKTRDPERPNSRQLWDGCASRHGAVAPRSGWSIRHTQLTQVKSTTVTLACSGHHIRPSTSTLDIAHRHTHWPQRTHPALPLQ